MLQTIKAAAISLLSYGASDTIVLSSAQDLALTLFVIVSAILLLTICFEFIHIYALASTTKYTHPIVVTLFSEMTVLGFLSLVTYAANASGLSETMSEAAFGSSGAEYLTETLETIHYMMFFILVLTIMQVVMLTGISDVAMTNFAVMNLIAQSHDDINPYLEKLEHMPHVTLFSWLSDYLTMGPVNAWNYHKELIDVDTQLVFYSLRKEFIGNRSALPNYLLASQSKRLPANFDFARYLSVSLSNYFVRVISFTPETWLMLWFFATIVYGIAELVNGDMLVMSIIWLIFGYLDLCVIYALSLKCTHIVEHLLNPSHFHVIDQTEFNRYMAERTPSPSLIDGSSHGTRRKSVRRGSHVPAPALHTPELNIEDIERDLESGAAGAGVLDQLQQQTEEQQAQEALIQDDSGETPAATLNVLHAGEGATEASESTRLLRVHTAPPRSHPSPSPTNGAGASTLTHAHTSANIHGHGKHLHPHIHTGHHGHDDAGHTHNPVHSHHSTPQHGAHHRSHDTHSETHSQAHTHHSHATYLLHLAETADHSSVCVRVRQHTLKTPLWTATKQGEQSWLSQFMLGHHVPNKQEQLFWGDKYGPVLNMFIFRVHLFVQSVYFALLVCYYIPAMYLEQGSIWGSIYLIVALIPFPVLIFGIYGQLLINMTFAASTGILREKSIVVEIIRQQKLEKVVRLLVMLTKLQAASKKGKKAAGGSGGDGAGKSYDPSDPKVKAEIAEISRIFDMYDTDGEDGVSVEELTQMFHHFGLKLSEKEMQEIFNVLDVEGDGVVSKQEFIDWKLTQGSTDKESDFKSIAKEIFNMFDEDGSGEITVEEFVDTLKRFDAGLTETEMLEIARDLDESGDGTLSLEEFERAIEQAVKDK